MAILHSYWHEVVNNVNSIYLMTSTGEEWEFHIATYI